jgi:nucleoside-diphosphate-sugar epimerase
VRVVVTGANGFIGAHTVRALVTSGDDVIAFVRADSDLSRLTDVAAEISVVEVDILDRDSAAASVRRAKPEACIHAAWYAEPGRYLTSERNIPFVTATVDLAVACAREGAGRFVGLGTCFEYEPRTQPLTEDDAVRPWTLYGATKLATWLILQQLGTLVGLGTAWARLFYQYGPNERPERLVPTTICSLLRGEEALATPGRQVRDFLHAADVGRAIVAIAGSDALGPVNVSSGRPVTVADIINMIGRILDRGDLIRLGAIPYGSGDPMHVVGDNGRLRSLGWAPQYGLEQGLADAVHWWRCALAPTSRSS